jgi:hypothetical protein
MTTKLTPAGEALSMFKSLCKLAAEFHNDINSFSESIGYFLDHEETIEKSLEMLDHVQRGETKELRRVDENSLKQAHDKRVQEFIKCCGSEESSTKEIIEWYWDAAPPYPATEATTT